MGNNIQSNSSSFQPSHPNPSNPSLNSKILKNSKNNNEKILDKKFEIKSMEELYLEDEVEKQKLSSYEECDVAERDLSNRDDQRNNDQNNNDLLDNETDNHIFEKNNRNIDLLVNRLSPINNDRYNQMDEVVTGFNAGSLGVNYLGSQVPDKEENLDLIESISDSLPIADDYVGEEIYDEIDLNNFDKSDVSNLLLYYQAFLYLTY